MEWRRVLAALLGVALVAAMSARVEPARAARAGAAVGPLGERLSGVDAASLFRNDASRRRTAHIVQPTETVCGIADRWGCSCRTLEAANAGRYRDQYSLPIGLDLYLPLGGGCEARR